MFGIFNKKKKAEPIKKDMATEVQNFILSYCNNNDINMDKLLLQAITVIENDNFGLEITVRAGFPQVLIGRGGRISKDLSKRMSKYLDTNLRLQVIM